MDLCQCIIPITLELVTVIFSNCKNNFLNYLKVLFNPEKNKIAIALEACRISF